MSTDQSVRPWMLDLGTAQRDSVPEDASYLYDDTEQITFLQEPNVAAIDVEGGPQTKKADIERGEDQK